MSFIVTDQNRYIGEHTCEREHYGDQSITRDACVLKTVEANELALKVAFTRAHPAVQMLTAYLNHLTDAELELFNSMTDKWTPA